MSVWYLPPFEYVRPRNLDQALRHLSDWGDETRIIAGGTDLIPSLRMRLFEPKYVLDISPLPELHSVELDRDRVRIGAVTPLRELERHPRIQKEFPVLAAALGAVAAPNIRNVGTLGGNLCLDTRCHWYNQSYFWRRGIGFCLKKDGSICHVAPSSPRCWAVYSGDGAAALLPLEAELVLVSSRGRRVVSLDAFFLDDGKTRLDLAPDEVLSEVRIPRAMSGYRGVYHKLRLRQSVDYPLAGVAVLVRMKGERPEDIRVGLTALGSRPRWLRARDEWLQEPAPACIEAVARAAVRAAKPLRTHWVVEPSYRQHWVYVMVRRALYHLLDVPYRPVAVGQ